MYSKSLSHILDIIYLRNETEISWSIQKQCKPRSEFRNSSCCFPIGVMIHNTPPTKLTFSFDSTKNVMISFTARSLLMVHRKFQFLLINVRALHLLSPDASYQRPELTQVSSTVRFEIFWVLLPPWHHFCACVFVYQVLAFCKGSIETVGYVQTPDRTGSGSITGSDRIGPGFLCYVHFFFDILFFMHSWKRFTAYKTIFTSHLHSNIKKNGPNITPPIYI